MTSQQLAHFSRVLALLVFEPEYRQLMESAHVLRCGREGRKAGRREGGREGGWLAGGRKGEVMGFVVFLYLVFLLVSDGHEKRHERRNQESFFFVGLGVDCSDTYC